MKKNFVAVIPARGGSKGVKNKNIKLLDSYPLIFYSIHVASKLKNIQKFIVTTDSSKIINVSKNYCHQDQIVKRPKKLATDKSKDIDYLKHLIKFYQRKKNK